jgi:D-inositol-3-phosphate glycosyltransferase
MSHHLQRLAFISTHTSPLALPGGAKAGGMNVYIAELTRELGRTGHQIDIFTRADHRDLPPIVDLAPNVRVIHIPAGPPTHLDPIDVHPWVPDFTRGLNDFVRHDGHTYDLIHSHYWLSGLSGIALADQWQRPHIAMFHTLGEVKNRARRTEREPAVRIDSERLIVQRSDRLICATPHERDFLAQLYGAHPDCISIVPGGVDLQRFQPGDRTAARRQLALPDGPLALFVGRLEPLKGVDIALRAIALTDLDTPLHLLIVGGDDHAAPERHRLQTLARTLGIAHRVTFIDAVPPDRLATYYRAANVCLVPSYYESFGLVAVEALASGTPVIATRVGGLQYTVRDGRTGYLVSWRCPEPFAERLETLLHNQDLARRFARAAPDSVSHFDWATVARQISGVYESLLERSALRLGCQPG